MSGFFLTLIVTSVCGAVCTMLSTGFEKHMKYIASLLCICVMITPFRQLNFSEIADSFDVAENAEASAEGDFDSITGELAEKNTEKYLCDTVFSKFGIKPRCADIEIDWISKEPTVTEISVTLEAGDMHLADDIGCYLSAMLGGEVKVYEA